MLCNWRELGASIAANEGLLLCAETSGQDLG
jgi:hypothetical protein